MKQELKYCGWIKSEVFGEFPMTNQTDELLKQVAPYLQAYQLGVAYLNKRFKNVKYTRFEHTLDGVCAVTKLGRILQEKLCGKIEITDFDVQIARDAFTVHDCGHPSFSHLAERSYPGFSHEERTFTILRTEFADFFNIECGTSKITVEDVIAILQGYPNVDCPSVLRDNPNFFYKHAFLFAIAKLISGGIDIDKIAYYTKDAVRLFDEVLDFTPLFDMIDFDVVNGNPEVVFESEGMRLLEMMILTRAKLQIDGYFAEDTLVNEEYFSMIVNKLIPLEKYLSMSQNDIMQYLNKHKNSSDFFTRRYCKIASQGRDKYVLSRRFTEGDVDKEADDLMERIWSYLPDCPFEVCHVIKRQVKVFDPNNAIFIRLSNGLIKPMHEVSKIFNQKIVLYVTDVYLDIKMLGYNLGRLGYDDKTAESLIDTVTALFEMNEFEKEKKYTCSSEDLGNAETLFRQLYDDKVECKQNVDLYYYTGTLDDEITARLRENKKEYTIKSPAADSAMDVFKRNEVPFKAELTSPEQFLKYLNKILLERGYAGVETLEIEFILRTTRNMYTIEYKGAVIEVVFDTTASSKEGQNGEKKACMLELEIKKGNTISLLVFCNEFLSTCKGLEECNSSKLKIHRDLWEKCE